MDGKSALEYVRKLLSEDEDTDFLDDKLTYQFLWQAATELATKTKSLKAEGTLTTVADQSDYTLDAGFKGLWLRDTDNELVVKLNDGSTDYFIKEKTYEEQVYENESTSVAVPTSFAIEDELSLGSQISGTASSDGSAIGGKSQLNDSGGGLSNASVGDIVHNTTDGSSGYILTVTSDIALQTALFGGTDNEWDSSDGYVIQPQSRKRLIFAPPPSIANNTVTYYFLKRPVPVFSDYQVYRFDNDWMFAVCNYAAWLYKYKDQEPNFGDRFYVYWQKKLSEITDQNRTIRNKRKFKVFHKRS